MAETLHDLVDALAQARDWPLPTRWRARGDALDRLEMLALAVDSQADPQLASRIAGLQARMNAVEGAFQARLRAAIRRGAGSALLRALLRGGEWESPAGDGYDALDGLVAGVLRLDAAQAEAAPLPADMVAYQPTPARHILGLIDRAGLGAADTLVDIGSGLGHVPLLVAACSGAHAVGIEREPAHVDRARACARALELARASFLAMDARDADLSIGTVFYLYTPFRGAVLRGVLDGLRRQADARPIRIFGYGPCVAELAREPWLHACGPCIPQRPGLFRSWA